MIYIDELPLYRPDDNGYCGHMMIDSSSDLSELHEFAEMVGLKRAWFHSAKRYPHYDLVESMRDLAIKHGARIVDIKDILELCRR